MAGLAHVSVGAVQDSIERCRRSGRRMFLAETGYRDSKSWQILFHGNLYPSKAILGHAAGLKPSQFFGGVAQTVPALERLGFQVRRGYPLRPTESQLALVAKHAEEAQQLPVDPAAYFHSGSNRPGEIRGLGRVGKDIGVCVQDLNESAIQELEALAGSGVQVFVDSGAFSEVDDQLRVIYARALDFSAWQRILQVYYRLAHALGDQVWLVAPDRVGSPERTFDLLRGFVDELRELHLTGARILLPMQGTISEFWNPAVELLGFVPIPAIPCKKNATTPAQLEEIAGYFSVTGQASHLHLLGLGPRNRNVQAYAEAIEAAGLSYSLDSNWIRANVGRQGVTRLYTRCRDAAKRLLGSDSSPAGVACLALILALGGAL